MEKTHNEIEAFFIDIDGTLVSNSRKKDLNLDDKIAIKSAIRNKKYVILSTGRSIEDIKILWEKIDNKTKYSAYVSANNGSIIWDLNKKIKVFEDNISEEDFKSIYNFAKENKYAIKNSGENKFYVKNGIFAKAVKLWKPALEIENDFSKAEYNNDNSRKIGMIVSISKRKVRSVVEELKLIYPTLEVVVSGPGLYIEINKKGVSKGNAAKLIANREGFKLENSVHIGDSMNDASGFEVCGYGVAMGNSMKELKKLSDYTTKKVSKSGVSQVIKSFSKTKNK